MQMDVSSPDELNVYLTLNKSVAEESKINSVML
jgi:hypothetical protein